MKKTETGLYYIYDKLAEVRLTNFLEFPNDAVATKSFCDFLEDKIPEQYSLVKIATIKDDGLSLYFEDPEDSGTVAQGQFAKDCLNRYISELKDIEDVQ